MHISHSIANYHNNNNNSNNNNNMYRKNINKNINNNNNNLIDHNDEDADNDIDRVKGIRLQMKMQEKLCIAVKLPEFWCIKNFNQWLGMYISLYAY